MKRILYLSFIFLFLFTSFPTQCSALSAQSAIVKDACSGRVLYSHNSDSKMGPASTTKILTAITALENCDVNSVATVSPTAYGVEGSSMYLVLGEKLTLENLLYGLMLVSGNDAATAIAEHVSGSVDEFAKLMNSTAKKAGAENSSFTNPHGLSDKNHYTTASDLAAITAYAMRNPKFREIVSTYKKSIPWKDHDYDRHLVNHNKFLNIYEGCVGVKTGFTKATGRCLVTAVEKNGMTLICVTMNAPDDWNDHKTLFDSAFSEYTPLKLYSLGDKISSVHISNSKTKATLTTHQDIYIPIRETEKDIKTTIIPSENLQVPINKGDIIGSLQVELNGVTINRFPLTSAESIDSTSLPIAKKQNSKFLHMLKKVFVAWLTCFE